MQMRVIANMAPNSDLAVNVTAVRGLNKNHALMVFEVAAESKPRTAAEYEERLTSVFGNRFRFVPASLFEFTDERQPHKKMMRVVVARNVVDMPYTPENQSKFTLVSANVFMDESDKMWRLEGEGQDKRIVQTEFDDFNEIFRSRQSRNHVLSSTTEFSVNARESEYACYFDVVANAIDFGFTTYDAQGGLHVFSRADCKLRRIIPDQILEAAYFDRPYSQVGNKQIEMPGFWRSSAVLAGAFDMAAYLDYMRTLYGNTEFFTSLERAIKDRATK